MTQVEDKGKTLNTACRDCTFAIWQDKLQVGCETGALDKYKQRGEKVWLETGNDKTFYMIENRFCVDGRGEEWRRKHEGKINLPLIVREENTLTCDLLVLTRGAALVGDIMKTYASVAAQELKPYGLGVILNSKYVRPSQAVAVASQHKLWWVQKVNEEGADDERCIDLAVDKCKGGFYCVVEAGFELPPNFFASIDKAINDDKDKFLALRPSNHRWNGLVVQRYIHNALKGNTPMKLEQYDDGELIAETLLDKIDYIAKKKNMEYMVKDLSEICNPL